MVTFSRNILFVLLGSAMLAGTLQAQCADSRQYGSSWDRTRHECGSSCSAHGPKRVAWTGHQECCPPEQCRQDFSRTRIREFSDPAPRGFQNRDCSHRNYPILDRRSCCPEKRVPHDQKCCPEKRVHQDQKCCEGKHLGKAVIPNDWCKGEKGDPGEDGEQGEQGEKGEKGEKGDAGPGGNEIIQADKLFDFDKFELRKESVPDKYIEYPELSRIAAILLRHPDLNLEISGFTDDVGGDAYNLTLSKKRAVAVKEWLCKNFATICDSISATGYGKAFPLVENSTPMHRAMNRRVEFKFATKPK